MVRALVTFTLSATLTCAASLWWLHDGDLADAIQPMLPELVPEWDATLLVRDAGVPDDPAEEPDPAP